MRGIEERFLRQGEKPFALMSPTSCDLTDFSRAARRDFPHLPVLNEPERAFRTIRAVLDYRDRKREVSRAAVAAPRPSDASVLRSLKARRAGLVSPTPLSEPESKALLRSYGVPVPEEGVAGTVDDAVALAQRIGYPVVIKAVAAALTHKSDVGAVRLGVGDADAVRRACAEIAANVARHDASVCLDGWLVARTVPAGLELVIGVQRDPEMGPVVMFGAGGVWLELVKDVAFAAPGLDRQRAERLIASTRAGRLIDGYRGAGPFDRAAVVDALVAVAQLAVDSGEAIDSLDINPFVALPAGHGAWALDALVILAGQPEERSRPETLEGNYT
jgi:acetyltransferase